MSERIAKHMNEDCVECEGECGLPRLSHAVDLHIAIASIWLWALVERLKQYDPYTFQLAKLAPPGGPHFLTTSRPILIRSTDDFSQLHLIRGDVLYILAHEGLAGMDYSVETIRKWHNHLYVM